MRPEVLAPAGDEECMRAAIRAGADAVYFGVQGFNARARAANFKIEELPRIFAELHKAGVKGFVTLNTLVFDEELTALEETVRAIASAGADAVIVQDLGVLSLVKAVAPSLAVHASTQMTCTDASSVRLARELGAERVVVARELSVDDIAAIRSANETELEVFVHGALCVSYSGQCLTSEAIGGRSANRGACAQACRLPYDLVVDGKTEDLGELAYLLSPEDLEATAVVAKLAELGVSSLKIEGRLKGPEYVASAVKLYRAAVDGADARALAALKGDALATYSRGSGPGFLQGVDHQRLVEGKTCEHRGLHAGTVRDVVRERGRALLEVELVADDALARGMGVLVEGGREGRGERGGRVWDVEVSRGTARVWLGPDVDVDDVRAGRRVFVTDNPEVDKRVLAEIERAPHREPLDVVARGKIGAPLELVAKSARGLEASAVTDAPLETARARGLDEELLRDKLGRLGDTPYELRTLTLEIPKDAALSPSSLNRARRALVDALAQSAVRTHATTTSSAAALLEARDEIGGVEGGGALPAAPATEIATGASSRPPAVAAARVRASAAASALTAGLFVLCRNLAQAEAAYDAGADGVWLDFLALTGTGNAVRALLERREGASAHGPSAATPSTRPARSFQIGVAPPRIRKPGEDKIDRFLVDLPIDALLVRSLGTLADLASFARAPATCVGDFSLNVTNRLSAQTVLGRGLHAFTPSFDLDASQLGSLLSTWTGPYAELVVHHPMPLFHTEHCLFASLLSEGKDYRTCGRPCETHVVSLRDRVGLENPIEADVGCRNTIFHAKAQSAASQVPHAVAAGVRRFRIELVRESADDVTRLVRSYRALIDGQTRPADVFKALNAEAGYGVVRGSLRVLS